MQIFQYFHPIFKNSTIENSKFKIKYLGTGTFLVEKKFPPTFCYFLFTQIRIRLGKKFEFRSVPISKKRRVHGSETLPSGPKKLPPKSVLHQVLYLCRTVGMYSQRYLNQVYRYRQFSAARVPAVFHCVWLKLFSIYK